MHRLDEEVLHEELCVVRTPLDIAITDLVHEYCIVGELNGVHEELTVFMVFGGVEEVGRRGAQTVLGPVIQVGRVEGP
jgi:hypothetical protein